MSNKGKNDKTKCDPQAEKRATSTQKGRKGGNPKLRPNKIQKKNNNDEDAHDEKPCAKDREPVRMYTSLDNMKRKGEMRVCETNIETDNQLPASLNMVAPSVTDPMCTIEEYATTALMSW